MDRRILARLDGSASSSGDARMLTPKPPAPRPRSRPATFPSRWPPANLVHAEPGVDPDDDSDPLPTTGRRTSRTASTTRVVRTVALPWVVGVAGRPWIVRPPVGLGSTRRTTSMTAIAEGGRQRVRPDRPPDHVSSRWRSRSPHVDAVLVHEADPPLGEARQPHRH